MVRILVFLASLPIYLLGDLIWTPPQTLFSVSGADGLNPQIVISPSSQRAAAVWLGEGSESTFYGAIFDGESWGGPSALSSAISQNSPRLTLDESGTFVAAWSEYNGSDWQIRSSFNPGSDWSSAESLQTLAGSGASPFLSAASSPSGGSVISWQDSDERVHGISWAGGVFSTPYFLSAEGLAVTGSETGFLQTVFATSDKVYITSFDLLHPPTDPVSSVAFLRPIVPASLSFVVNPSKSNSLLTVQDAGTNFLVGGFYSGGKWKYTAMGILETPIQNIKADYEAPFINPMATAIWEASDGSIQAVYLIGNYRWAGPTTLSSNGKSPSIALNPATGHAIAVWADFQAGGNNNTIQVSEFNLSSWSTPVSISSGGNLFSSTEIVINGDGDAWIIWSRQPTSSENAVIEVSASE